MKSYEEKIVKIHLYSQNCVLREKAAEFISKTNSTDIAKKLVKELSNYDRFVAIRAAFGLSLMKENISLPLLKIALMDPETCENAILALRLIKSHKSEKIIAKALKSKNPLIRNYAVRGITDKPISKTPEVQKTLINMLDYDDKGSVTLALGGIKSKKVLDILAKAIKKKNFKPKAQAIYCLAKAKDKRAIPYLLNMLNNHSNHSDQSMAMSNLESLSSPYTIDAILDYMSRLKNGKDTNMLHQSARTLDTLKRALATEKVIHFLDSKDYKLRLAGVTLLGAIACENSQKHLIKMLSDENWAVRASAAEALGNIPKNKNEGADMLINILSDEFWYVRAKAAEALGKIGGDKAVKFLLKRLNDENEFVVAFAAEALNKISNPLAEKRMIKGLSKENWSFMKSSFEFLGKIKSKKAVPILIKKLSDYSWYIRMQAAETLGKIGDKRAVKPLKKILKNENYPEVYIAAQNAIRQIKEPKMKTFPYLYNARIK